MRRLLPYIAVLLSMLIWSASGIAVKEALVALSPMTMIVIRFTLAVLLMLVVGLCARKSEMFRLQKVDKKDLPLFILGGIFQPFLYYILETFSYDALSSPTIAEALLSTSPVLAPFFAAAILREHVTRYNILGIIVSTVGMLLLVLVGASDFSIGNPWGIACAFAAVSAAVLYTIVLRRIPPGYNPLTVVFYVQLSALVLFYPLCGFTDGVSGFVRLADIAPAQLWRSLAAVGYLALGASVVAFICFCYTVRVIGVTRTNAFNNVRPAFTAIWMLLFFGEQLPWAKWLGIFLIIIGLFVCQKQPSKPLSNK
mgnify:FL=1